MQYIYTLLNAATSYPTITEYEGIKIVSWQSSQGGCFVVWSEDNKDVNIKLRYSLSAKMYNYIGDEISDIDKNNFLVTDDVVFIIGTDEIMFNLNI